MMSHSTTMSPTQCLHPGVVKDLADSDDEDCPFKPLEEPVTIETKCALAECVFVGGCSAVFIITKAQISVTWSGFCGANPTTLISCN